MACTDSQIEPAPQEINGEVLTPGTNRAADARLNIHARGFWELQGQWRIQGRDPGSRPPLFFDQNEARRPEKHFFGDCPPPPPLIWRSRSPTEGSAFFDVRVCYPNAESYKGLTTKQIYRQHESEKKRMYASRVLEVEQGSFTPMVFTTTAGRADECKRYHSRLAELQTRKERIIVLQFHGFASVSFALLRCALFLTCVREAHVVREELRWTLQITTLKSIRNQRDFRIRTFNIFHI